MEWSTYFSSRVRKAKGKLQAVRTEQGSHVEKKEEVLGEVAIFYKGLYKERGTDKGRKCWNWRLILK